jgi:hypothetical protein
MREFIHTTLSIDPKTLKRGKVVAALQGTTLSGLLRKAIDEAYERYEAQRKIDDGAVV